MAQTPPDEADLASTEGAQSAGHGEHLELPDAEEVDGELHDGPSDSHPRIIAAGSFSGPLPPPAVLREYNEVVPGLAREIVDQWKLETAHRHGTIDQLRQIDRDSMTAYYDGEKRGQIFGLILGLGVITVAIVAIILDRPAVGVTGIIAGAAATIWAVRRSPSGPPDDEPKDLGAGDAIEQPPERAQPN